VTEAVKEESAVKDDDMTEQKLLPRGKRADVFGPCEGRQHGGGRRFLKLADGGGDDQFVWFESAVSRDRVGWEGRALATRAARKGQNRVFGAAAGSPRCVFVERDAVVGDDVYRRGGRGVESVQVKPKRGGSR
jgi:hypothetical protein